MAGFKRIYVLGGEGGFMGADGVNPIDLMILHGVSDREWLEPHYFKLSLKPKWKLRVIVPEGPDHPNALIDACIAFCPKYFKDCPSFKNVELALKDMSRLDFNARPNEIPANWTKLREEARSIFNQLNIWEADFKQFNK
ncbi:MAG: hypothetical protein ACP5E3_08845 [Bacteroidales bacterium]